MFLRTHTHKHACVCCSTTVILQSDDDPPEERSLETRTETSTRAMPGCSTWDPRASSEVPCEHRAQSSRHKGGFQAATGTSVPATSKAHLFIFDRESQDVESQPDFTERPAAQERLQESSDSGAAHPLSQMQLEEDRQRIRKLMEETKRVTIFLLCFTVFSSCSCVTCLGLRRLGTEGG